MEAKKWFESKVALFNLVMAVLAAVAVISPQVAEPAKVFVQQYFAEAGLGWALINIVLRLFKSNVVF